MTTSPAIAALNARLANAEEAGPADVLADAVALLREAATLYDAREQPDSAALLRRLARELTAAPVSSAVPDHTAPLAEVWVVWRDDLAPFGYFATEDIAKQATIDCWEEDEPSCPDYSWRPDGGRGNWELLVGDERAGVYAYRHPVYGPPVPPPADRSTALLWAADRFDGMPEAQAPALQKGITWATSELRRLAAEAQRSDVGAEFVRQIDDPDEAALTAFEAALSSKTAPKADSKPEPGGDLIDAYLKFLRGQGPAPDLSDLPAEQLEAITGQLQVVRALADRDPNLPPIDRDPVARRLGLHPPAAGVRQPDTETRDELATARATNQRLNLRAQQLESELAAYRRAVGQWEVGERGTYIPHASLRAIGKACGVDILGSVRHLKHFERVEQAEAAIERVRRLHDQLAEETDLVSPDDPITRGAAAKRIATALDGWNPTGAPQCDVEFEGGGRCAKPAGHRPPGSDDPHVPAVSGRPAAEAGRVVAYRSLFPGALSLYCTGHADELGAYIPLTSDDLPDGGLCASCGADVLIPQEERRG